MEHLDEILLLLMDSLKPIQNKPTWLTTPPPTPHLKVMEEPSTTSRFDLFTQNPKHKSWFVEYLNHAKCCSELKTGEPFTRHLGPFLNMSEPYPCFPASVAHHEHRLHPLSPCLLNSSHLCCTSN